MSSLDRFQFKPRYTPPGQADIIGTITAAEIQAMTMQEFLSFQGQLVNVRRRKRRDLAAWEKNNTITTAMSKEIFRKGLGDQDTYATSATEFTKTRAQTNMQRGGNFGEGSLTIISQIEAYVHTTALIPTTVAGGVITNPLGLAALTLWDPAMVEVMLQNQFELGFYRGETLIVDGLLKDFPQAAGVSGSIGNSVGGVFQNALFDGNFLDNPQVLANDEDFHVLLSPLCSMDFTAATGENIQVTIGVELNTVELRRLYA